MTKFNIFRKDSWAEISLLIFWFVSNKFIFFNIRLAKTRAVTLQNNNHQMLNRTKWIQGQVHVLQHPWSGKIETTINRGRTHSLPSSIIIIKAHFFLFIYNIRTKWPATAAETVTLTMVKNISIWKYKQTHIKRQ